ncbi:uncharacterized protein LOC118599991 [Xyrichtys novacula]|uniref:Uncharacterized protein LOC118599991 n=1 Tax=Xyrichtys novacula TaxID=13765 RepID=A0AAV1F919_XYRNO|nr:uncharacterized protein LOC118599991 [Xyrichtys novacula]
MRQRGKDDKSKGTENTNNDFNTTMAELNAQREEFKARLKSQSATLKAQINEFQSDVSIIIVGLALTEGEISRERANALLFEGLKCDPVPEIVNTERTTPQGQGPGVIKVEFRTVQDKVGVLRLPFTVNSLCGKDYFLTGNGRLVKRDQQQDPSRTPASEPTRRRSNRGEGVE